MSKRAMVLGSVALVVVLLGAAVALPALAQEPTLAPQTCPRHGGGFRGMCGQAGMEAMAEALDMTTEELSTQLWGGRTLADLADRAGVELEALQEAVDAACEAAKRDAIEQAVEDGRLTRENADWLLEGLEHGFLGGGGLQFGRGFGFGRGMRGHFGGFSKPSSGRFGFRSSSL